MIMEKETNDQALAHESQTNKTENANRVLPAAPLLGNFDGYKVSNLGPNGFGFNDWLLKITPDKLAELHKHIADMEADIKRLEALEDAASNQQCPTNQTDKPL
jgi:hypothetical protein